MKMPTVFTAGKLIAVGLVAVVLALHPGVILKKNSPVMQQEVAPQIATQVVRDGQQITDLERRVGDLERANLAVQIATIQSQLAIDHQFLMGILLMMITLAAEAVWRTASSGKQKRRTGD